MLYNKRTLVIVGKEFDTVPAGIVTPGLLLLPADLQESSVRRVAFARILQEEIRFQLCRINIGNKWLATVSNNRQLLLHSV